MTRLRWLCRRGMKELDVVLTRYLEQGYLSASEAEQAQFRALLEMSDPDLYNLLLGRDATSDPERTRLLQELRRF
ncbi:succinate dehydrogenase assembly factor 2 [Gammaproteobacteria bacterium]|nr:succinate dehydrogenase assembly factor 2 [Gammaproteobacteria bacterium]